MCHCIYYHSVPSVVFHSTDRQVCKATLGKSTQDWEILVHGKSQMVLGRGVGPWIKRNKIWSHSSSITLKEVTLWLPQFFSLVTLILPALSSP